MINYPLALDTWDNEETIALHEVIKSKKFTMGDHVKKFELDFAKYIGSKFCVMVNSGSSANLLAVAALFYCNNPLKKNDEVIVPAVSWSTTYFPFHQYGLTLKFVDIDLDTLNYNLEDLKRAISKNTKAICVVNLLGNPNDFNEINKIISGTDIKLIEDNCESMGSSYSGKKTGTFGIMGTFSTFFSHHISTMEGGLVVTDDEELYQILISLRAHGWTRHLPKKNLITKEKNDFFFYDSYNFILPGYNFRPTELNGILGSIQLKKFPHFLKMRELNSQIYKEEFNKWSFLKTQKEIHQSSWFGFSFILEKNAPVSRDQLVKHLTSKGVECRPIVAGNFLKNPVIKHIDHECFGELKNADILHDGGLFIGNHHIDLRNKLVEIKESLSSFFLKDKSELKNVCL